MIDYRWDLVAWCNGCKIFTKLFFLGDINLDDLVGNPYLFQENTNFSAIWCWPVIYVDQAWVLRLIDLAWLERANTRPVGCVYCECSVPIQQNVLRREQPISRVRFVRRGHISEARKD